MVLGTNWTTANRLFPCLPEMAPAGGDHRGVVKLADFGLSKRVVVSDFARDTLPQTITAKEGVLIPLCLVPKLISSLAADPSTRVMVVSIEVRFPFLSIFARETI